MSNSRFGLRTRKGEIRSFIEGNVAISNDVDAQAFIDAAGITATTQQSAINTLVVDLKNNSLWTKFKAIYPFVGGTATTHMYNLRNPANTNAAFRLSFSGGWTHSANGAQPNGTNGFANTFYNLQIESTVNNAAFGAYLRTNSTTGLQVYGSFQLPLIRVFNNLSNGNIQIADNDVISYTPNPSTGFFFSRRESNVLNQSYRNGVSLGTTNSLTNSLPNNNFYFGATNNNGTTAYFTTHQIAFGVLGGNGTITNSEASTLYSIIQTFQTTLGRNV